ncbi:MAG TPA: sporulation protein, partial [Roseateles sp.]
MSSASKPAGQKHQKGGFVLGLIVGLLIGLAISLGVALYINKTPIPFMNKVPQRTADQDAQEAERNKNWDPNAPLAGKGARSASGVVAVPPPL